jgi:hypothetical protein
MLRPMADFEDVPGVERAVYPWKPMIFLVVPNR